MAKTKANVKETVTQQLTSRNTSMLVMNHARAALTRATSRDSGVAFLTISLRTRTKVTSVIRAVKRQCNHLSVLIGGTK